jgi:hypothetical protein
VHVDAERLGRDPEAAFICRRRERRLWVIPKHKIVAMRALDPDETAPTRPQVGFAYREATASFDK